MPYLAAKVLGVSQLTRQSWHATPQGQAMRQTLLTALTGAPGYTGRVFPSAYEVKNEFTSAQQLTAFMNTYSNMLAQVFGTAKTYYEQDEGCSVQIRVNLGGNDIVLNNPNVPSSFIL
jgi:hypothetical protein